MPLLETKIMEEAKSEADMLRDEIKQEILAITTPLECLKFEHDSSGLKTP